MEKIVISISKLFAGNYFNTTCIQIITLILTNVSGKVDAEVSAGMILLAL